MTQLILHHSCASNPRESTDTDSTPRLKKGPEIAGTGSQIETRSHVSLSSFSPPHYRNPRNRNLMLLGSQAGDSHIDVAHWSIHTAGVIGQEASSWSLCAPASEEFELCSSSNRIHIKDLPIRNTLHNQANTAYKPTPDVDDAQDEVKNNCTLRTLRRNSKNLVLDSTYMIVGQDNVAPAQSVDSLMVSAVRSPLLASVAEIEPDVTLEALPDCPSNPNSLQSLETTHIESRICSDPAVSLNKSLFSKCAWLASVEALKRADLAESHPETNPEWVDPAIPLLLEARKYLGTLIIDSPNPSITPHIIINEPPAFDNDPWIKLFNSTQNPQDSAYGNCLIVPSPVVEVINCKPVKATAAAYEDGYTTTASSTVSTPPMLTPILEVDEPIPGVVYSSYPASTFVDEFDENNIEDDMHRFDIDDDEEDLPPLDDWYQDIASRTGVNI